MQNVQCKMQNHGSAFKILHFSFCILHFIVIVVLALSQCPTSTAAEPKLLEQKLLDDGWISLFDGETLFGWKPSGGAKWEVVDGEIRTAAEKNGFLMTTTEWADFALHVEFKAPATTNSGIFLRSALEPSDPTNDCIELNIAPKDNPFPTASLVKRGKVSTEPKGGAIDAWDGKWHTFDTTIAGHVMTIALDGQKLACVSTNELPDGKTGKTLAKGHVGLQAREGQVAFRNIRLKPLSLKPLFDGKTLDGWNLERAELSKFEVTPNGEMHLTKGRGQIETADDFTNFVLQLDCKVNGDGLNSGIFFRTLRTGRWVGYESQINNKMIDGDRTKPADCGTGGIYRRQSARRVISDDHQWFTKTLVVDGPHVAVWVNGYQVSDWTDKRPPKDNPREGRRDAGGAIAIQGHDPTTDFLFRKIQAVELPR